MILITCIDDRGGMQFNHRRQSRDRVLTAYLQNRWADHPLRMAASSASLFPSPEGLLVSEDFLQEAGEADCCFAEAGPLLPWAEKIRTLVLCKWNRVYPADVYFDLPLDDGSWHLVSREEFPGSSHDKLTVEVYEK